MPNKDDGTTLRSRWCGSWSKQYHFLFIPRDRVTRVEGGGACARAPMSCWQQRKPQLERVCILNSEIIEHSNATRERTQITHDPTRQNDGRTARRYLRVRLGVHLAPRKCACSSLRWPRRPWPISEGILNRLLRRGRGIGAGCCDELQSRQRGARESSLEDVQALIRESIVV